MDEIISKFEKRWDTVSRETLSALRRQFNAYSFDGSEVERAFRRACNEWFDGGLASQLWYDNLAETKPEVAEKFKEYVTHITFEQPTYTKPKRIITYVSTLLSMPLCYYSLDEFTDMGFVSKALTTVGTAVLVWYGVLSIIKGRESKLEEKAVEFYRTQLEKEQEAIKAILS